MAESRLGNALVLLSCFGLILILGVLGFLYEKHRGLAQKGTSVKKETKVVPAFYTISSVENTVTVGGQGYFIDFDVTFLLEGGKESEKTLHAQETRLRDIAIASMSNTHFDIRTPTGRKEVQREILRQVRMLEPKVSEVLFPNLLMLPVFGAGESG